jgi:hypothetical protein
MDSFEIQAMEFNKLALKMKSKPGNMEEIFVWIGGKLEILTWEQVNSVFARKISLNLLH